jgi:type II secretory pathway pseudopilin PulG
MFRYAFTMIELVFIIIILSILTMLMAPRLQTSHLQEAADQLIKHIRLAQSLALSQDFYLADSTQSNEFNNSNQKNKAQKYWFKRWWQIEIPANGESYSIYSDSPTIDAITNIEAKFTALPDTNDLIAIDVQSCKMIVRPVTGISENNRFTDVDLLNKYNVSIKLPNSCSSVSGSVVSRAVLFDHIGRPHCTKPDTGLLHMSLNPYDKLMNKQRVFVITEQASNQSINICIEPESGYVRRCE